MSETMPNPDEMENGEVDERLSQIKEQYKEKLKDFNEDPFGFAEHNFIKDDLPHENVGRSDLTGWVNVTPPGEGIDKLGQVFEFDVRPGRPERSDMGEDSRLERAVKVEDTSNGCAVLTENGRLWFVTKEELARRTHVEEKAPDQPV